MCTGTHENTCSNNKHLNDEVPNASLPARFDLIPLNHVIQTTQTFSPSFSHAFSLWTAFTYIINFMLAFIFCALDSRRENTYACLTLRVIHIIYDCKEGSPPSSHCVMSLVFKYFFFLCWEQSEVRMQDFTVISTPDGDVPNSLFKVSM